MVSPKLNTWTCLSDREGVAQFVYDTLTNLEPGSVWTMIIRHSKSGDYYAHIAIGESSVEYETLDYYDQPPGI
jgi:hypothetical protein